MLKLVLAGAFGVALMVPASAAQTACGNHDSMVGHLGKKYGEARIAVGLEAQGRMIEVLTSEKGGTWSIIVTTPNGTSCLVAAGQSWQSVAKVAMAPEL